jgi:hypothetical protein
LRREKKPEETLGNCETCPYEVERMGIELCESECGETENRGTPGDIQ